jgi:N-acetylglucosamine malate deacetylase 1
MGDAAPAPPEIWSAPPPGRVLVLAPHQDDETIGCGGILALHRSQGDPVRVVFLTDGGAGDPAGHFPPHGYVALRQTEARRACRVLGVTDLEFWGYPDGKLGAVAELGGRLLAAVDTFAPASVYYPSSRELHPDHWAAGALVDALHRAGRWRAPAYGYEIWAAIEPTHVIDVSAVVETKLAALAEYPSQLRYNDYRPKMLGLAAYRTLCLPPGARYAEAFRRLG